MKVDRLQFHKFTEPISSHKESQRPIKSPAPIPSQKKLNLHSSQFLFEESKNLRTSFVFNTCVRSLVISQNVYCIGEESPGEKQTVKENDFLCASPLDNRTVGNLAEIATRRKNTANLLRRRFFSFDTKANDANT